MTKKLIVTADDYGMHEHFNDGILEAIAAKRVTAVSVMVNGAAFTKDYVDKLMQYVNSRVVRVGVHFDLGKREKWASMDDNERIHQIRAQYEIFNMRFDFYPNHMDSHYHFHIEDPAVFRQVRAVAKYYNTYVRSRGDEIEKLKSLGIKTCDKFLNTLQNSPANLLAEATDGINEIMFHPGHYIEGTTYLTTLTDKRQKDLDFLLSDEFESFLKQHKIELIRFC